MKRILRKTTCLLFLLFPLLIMAQEAATPKAPPSTRVQRQIAKRKWKEDRAIKKEKEQQLTEHNKIQTKAVQKRMKKNQEKSKRINENKRKFSLKRWFSK